MVHKNASQYQLIVTSYEILRKDIDSFKMSFNYCVLDEGHIIRNPNSKITQAIKHIQCNRRLILTGTPIQNNVLELWSLFDFLMPGFLGTQQHFTANYSKPVMLSRNAKASTEEQEKGIMALEALHRQVLPFILRRLKGDVLQDLPPKVIQDVVVELSPLQSKLYSEFLKNNQIFGENTESLHTFQALQYLRKLTFHPKLVLNTNHPSFKSLVKELVEQGTSLDDICHSAKLLALKELLHSCGIGIKSEAENDVLELNVVQSRVLIFSQLKQTLSIVENDLFKRHMPTVSYLKLDGDVPSNARMSIVDKFNSNPSIDVLLLTVSIGGLGLNLTGANIVIFLEHDWNPQNDIQAMDRVHRIGQKKTVNVYRLITKDTLEEKIMSLQKFKLKIADTVVNKENQSFQSMSTHQLLDLFEYSENEKKSKVKQEQGIEDSIKDIPGKTKMSGLKAILASLEEYDEQSKLAEEYDLNNFLANINTGYK
ncbi:TATA-binding protein-associated factor 172-like [Schistocerca gregaria]|uniref:TATA-binding protein-associated factor 172-like n=1 Tax=Schistocerca gregaria TaxID=7010 RepID=UPI00211F3489|nr:TATA-binding protein-associated factor 172-like [Schistocerca gregaria]